MHIVYSRCQIYENQIKDKYKFLLELYNFDDNEIDKLVRNDLYPKKKLIND